MSSLPAGGQPQPFVRRHHQRGHGAFDHFVDLVPPYVAATQFSTIGVTIECVDPLLAKSVFKVSDVGVVRNDRWIAAGRSVVISDLEQWFGHGATCFVGQNCQTVAK